MAKLSWTNRAALREARHRQELKCFWCGEKTQWERRGRDRSPLGASVDHLIPVGLGGNNEPGNFVAAHRRCNEARAATLPTVDDVVRAAAIHGPRVAEALRSMRATNGNRRTLDLISEALARIEQSKKEALS